MLETRTINHFAQALEQKDLPDLKAATSDTFEKKALRLDESLDDFKILRLPTGETSIVKVEDVSDEKKRVTVEVGESKRKLLYELTRNSETKKWVVDDVFVKQKRKGLTAAKSVTEQMDLLLSVREFLDAWKGGGRDEVLGATTPAFAQLLGELPPVFLARLTKRVVNDKSKMKAFRPEAELDEEVAVVRLPRTTGQVVLSFELIDGDWKVADVAVQAKGESEHIPSVRKMAGVMLAAVTFLESYASADHATLVEVCSKRFFDGSLAHADLQSVKLPTSDEAQEQFEVKMQDRRADLVIQGDQEFVTISLERTQDDADSDTPKKYLVEEVTIYELDGRQQMRLSALFTAHAVMQIFNDSLIAGNLDLLRKTSTADFRQRVWDRLDAPILSGLPFAEIENAPQEVLSTVFDGAVTEITVMQGQRALTFVLRDHGGEVRVDDVLLPVSDRPNSLKETCELMLPVLKLAAGMRTSRIELVQRQSSKEFNRLVWHQTQLVPGTGFVAADHLRARLTAIDRSSDPTGKVMITLGTSHAGAHVLLIKEHGRFVVDDVLMIAGPQPHQQARLKQALRTELAGARVRPRPMASARPQPQRPAPQQLPVAQSPAARPPVWPTEGAFRPPAGQPGQTYRQPAPRANRPHSLLGN